MNKLKFDELNLSKAIQKAISDMGFEEASPIQSESIPVLLEGKDIIGKAQTGTGKTAAFAIPVIERIDLSAKNLQAIILCPTRELIIQVAEEFRKLLKYNDKIQVVPVYGGQEIERQLRALRNNPQIVIGTPGRTMDHIRRGSIKMDTVRMVVLDEADEMLDMGFRDDIEVIIKDTTADRQTILFSATMPPEIQNITKRYQKDPQVIDVTHHKVNAPKIDQVYFEIIEKNKPEALARLIDLHDVKLALVFCNTKVQVDSLVEDLKARGYFAEGLHGDLTQKQRDKVMGSFRNGSAEILVATDVAGRGIDVSDVEAVFNYDLPRDDEDYVHRIGRTGRAGKSGIAFTFVTGKQVYNLKRIERSNGVKIERKQIPSLDDLEATRIKGYEAKIKEIIDGGHMSKFVNQVERLMGDDYTSIDIAAALLKITVDNENGNFDDTLDFNAVQREEFTPHRGGFGGKRTYGGDNRQSFNRGGSGGGGRDGFKKPYRDRNDRDNNDRKPFRKFEDDKPSGFSKPRFPKDEFKKPFREKSAGDFDKSEKKPFRKFDDAKPDADRAEKGKFAKDEFKKPFREKKEGEKRTYKPRGDKKPFESKDFKPKSDKKSGFPKSDKPSDKDKGKRRKKSD